MRLAHALALLAWLPGQAAAHPHVFVDATASFRFDADGALVALRIGWTYDAFTTLVMFDQLALDADRDGLLDDADRAAIVAGETDWPEGYDGDVHLDLGGAPVAMGRPENGAARLEDDRVTVTFDLPLASPLPAPDGARLRLFDPIYFYDYTLLEAQAADDAPCAATLVPYEPDAAGAALQATLAMLSREEMPEDENVGALFADAVTLTCG